MEFLDFPVSGPFEVLPKKHGDARGYFAEIFRENAFSEHAGVVPFVQENQSLSARPGTIRGLHFQTHPAAQGKLVRCIAGAIFDVAVDIRHDSPTFGQWIGVELTAEKLNQLWVPVGFAHGFCTLTPDTVVAYKVTSGYSPENDRGILWNDPALAVKWPDIADSETLSEKDRSQPLLADLLSCFSLKD
jgi:dTDP-4-dehydrorhamnose 3,5-epimerase